MSDGAIPGFVYPKIYLQVSLAFFLQYVLTVFWLTSVIAMSIIGFLSSIPADFFMDILLRYVVMVATVGRAAIAKFAFAGVV